MNADTDAGWCPSPRQAANFRSEVLSFFAANQRDLPWRTSRNPYEILVAEVMLQQTQVSRVIEYYSRFLTRFPTLESLTEVEAADVLRLWQGLGYNRRAVYLQRAAISVVCNHRGKFPQSVSHLERLPGVGHYTARAIACFAFEQRIAVVETNVRKAIAFFADRVASGRPYSTDAVADRLLPRSDPWTWNQALIDFGALAIPPRPRRANAVKRRFEETNRYWRGRILAALCAQHAAIPICELLLVMPTESAEFRIRKLVTDLDSEGLVRYVPIEDTVKLPGS